MLEAAATLELSVSGLTALPHAGSAVSREAESVGQRIAELRDSAERSEALFGHKSVALSQLWALAKECSESNWNGDGARPLSLQALDEAAAVIRALPSDVPLPEFAAEPDGAVSLDWIQSRNRLFSVSAAGPRLSYAWVDGSDRGHGVARFDGETIPARILEGIKAVTGNGDPRVRSR